MDQIPVGSVHVENNLRQIMPQIERRFRTILTENKRVGFCFYPFRKNSGRKKRFIF